MYDRPFGVEIECLSPITGRHDRYHGATRLGAAGTIKLLADNGFTNWDKVGWDGSEIEIKSPVLQGAAGMKELKSVMNLLKERGYTTTTADGMHCHFDSSDLSDLDIIRIIKSWDNVKDVVQKFLGDRFTNHHCTYRYNFDHIDRNGIWGYDGQKCYAIEPRSRLGTLEFRQHFGTVEAEDAEAWILLVQAFIKNVKNRKNVLQQVSMEELFRLTRVYKIAQRNLANRKFGAYGVRV